MSKLEKIGSGAGIVLSVLLAGTVTTNFISTEDTNTISITYEEMASHNADRADTLFGDTAEAQPAESRAEVTTSTSAPVTESTAPATTAAQTSTVATTATTTTATTAVTTWTEPVETEPPIEVTVYVSSTGKYHSKSDCSGMKSYTEMSLDEALENGCVACKRCW